MGSLTNSATSVAVRWALAAAAVVFCSVGASAREVGKRCLPKDAPAAAWWYEPCPSADTERELRTPLPFKGAVLVFRRIDTPGKAFFPSCASAASRDRASFVELGEKLGGDAFSLDRPRSVRGGFFDAASNDWYLLIGKYELTVGQAASILASDPTTGARFDGSEKLAAGIRRLAKMIGESGVAKGRSTVQAVASRYSDLAERLAAKGPGARDVATDLARPVTGLTPFEYQGLATRYSQWCYRSAECAAALKKGASFEGAPGFFRLPSEFEWEYVARGGALSDRFNDPLPFDADDLKDFAVLGARKRAAPIGITRRASSGGLFDVIGNVSEITADAFTMEYGYGKVGGRAARGGNYLLPPDAVTTGAREEVALYDFAGQGGFLGVARSETLGARFSIGAVVKASEEAVRVARAARRAECAIGDGGDPLAKEARAIGALATEENPERRKRLRAEAEGLSRKLDDRTRELCIFLSESLFDRARAQVRSWTQFEIRTLQIADFQALIEAAPSSDSIEIWRRSITRLRGQREFLRRQASLLLSRYLSAARKVIDHGGERCLSDGFGGFAAKAENRETLAEPLATRDSGVTGLVILERARVHARQLVRGGARFSRDQIRNDFVQLGAKIAKAVMN